MRRESTLPVNLWSALYFCTFVSHREVPRSYLHARDKISMQVGRYWVYYRKSSSPCILTFTIGAMSDFI